MRAKSVKPTTPEFPPHVCGVCSFCSIDKDQQAFCWVNPPRDTDDTRGIPIDPYWPSCKEFKPRLHA